MELHKMNFYNSIKKFEKRGLDNNYRHGVSYLRLAGILSDMQWDGMKAVAENIVPTIRRAPFKLAGGRVLDIRGMEGKETREEMNMGSYLQFKQS